MLHDKYLPNWDIRSIHSTLISGDPAEIFPFIRELDMSDSLVLQWLFKLRGLPRSNRKTSQALQELHFTLLEMEENKAVLVGLIGKFWTSKGDLKKFQPDEFTTSIFPNHAKATWSFELDLIHENKTRVRTETRVFCPSRGSKRKFKIYWFFIGPFSALVRLLILRSIKRKVEKPNDNIGTERKFINSKDNF